MALADNSDHVSSMSFLNTEITIFIGFIVIAVFSSSVFGWVVGGLIILGFFVWIMANNRYRDFECSKCTYME